MSTNSSTTDPATVDMAAVRQLVDRAVRAAVPAAQMTTRKIRPESDYGFPEPRPLAGLQAALAVTRLAQDQAYTFAKGLRGEGSSWDEIADLLEIEWSEDYARRERAFELVAGPASTISYDRYVFFTCGGPRGCGERVTDRGPYIGYPSDNEDGHAEGCRRLAAEVEAYRREQDERERRDQVMDETFPLVTDTFGKETVQRVRYVQSHGGRYLGWSTSETLAVALVLRDDEQLAAVGYASHQEAIRRIVSGMSTPPRDPAGWLATVRAAATGLRD
ncbi:hypothetical protein [Micromonospora andamanensis]|uniref:hypothetical protein n=1 Tax=Micromonospora andamanensis TaxID=1287068 RepID=UPI0019502A4F|nr:hypothetical protein [Micromonospora andamanensis]GIJ40510.1 hypothetical protein Vwe01_38350 [Micromonospora andamanensis]